MSYSFLDLAYDVLKQSPKPLTYQEVWEAASEKGLAAKVSTAGKTPWQSVGSQLYVDVRDNDASAFIKIGKRPARFFLREHKLNYDPTPSAKLNRKKPRRVRRKSYSTNAICIHC